MCVVPLSSGSERSRRSSIPANFKESEFSRSCRTSSSGRLLLCSFPVLQALWEGLWLRFAPFGSGFRSFQPCPEHTALLSSDYLLVEPALTDTLPTCLACQCPRTGRHEVQERLDIRTHQSCKRAVGSEVKIWCRSALNSPRCCRAAHCVPATIIQLTEIEGAFGLNQSFTFTAYTA